MIASGSLFHDRSQVKLYEDKFWVGGFLTQRETNSGFVPTPNLPREITGEK